MRSYKITGIVLKRKNIGEADRMLTVLTQDFGKIEIKAVGVRRVPSRRASHVELLNFSELSLYKGKGYPILTEATTIENFSVIKEDLQKVGFAYHICELVDGLCPENQENNKVFGLLYRMLCSLAKEENITSILREFEINLLTVLGYVPESYFNPSINTAFLIESILERKLKSRQIIPHLS